MSSVTLTLKGTVDEPLDCRQLLPEKLCALDHEKITKLKLDAGNTKHSVGELFDIQIADGDDILRLSQMNERMHYLGAGMTGGRLLVDGDAGNYLGRDMRAGEIIVNGNAQDFAGSGQRAGLINIKGSVGDYAGGAAHGEMQGLKGGIVMIGGACGSFLGYKMRRGMIIAHEAVADHCANNMIAGTLILGNSVGENMGLGMRRGTLVLLEKLQHVLPTFNDCGNFSLAFIQVLRHHVHATSHHMALRLAKIKKIQRYCGDLGYDGQGEILVADYRS